MGGEETLWRNAYEEKFCYDCLNFECGRKFDDMVACQWKKTSEMIKELLKNDDDISD